MKFSGDETELESKAAKTFDLVPRHYAGDWAQRIFFLSMSIWWNNNLIRIETSRACHSAAAAILVNFDHFLLSAGTL